MIFRRVDSATNEELALEWDLLGPIRDRQVSDGVDTSYSTIRSHVLQAVNEAAAGSLLLDAGCGTGELAGALRGAGFEVSGVDASEASIAIARERVAGVHFHHQFVERFAETTDQRFDVVVANMVLMDVADLAVFLGSIASMTRTGGMFVATITHPFFWPRYWGYETEDWYRYSEEVFVRGPFRIAAETTDAVSTHVHRPIGMYVECIWHAGFTIHAMEEITVGTEQVPRFLMITSERIHR